MYIARQSYFFAAEDLESFAAIRSKRRDLALHLMRMRTQRVEDHSLINPIQEFRTEVVLQFAGNRFFDVFRLLAHHGLDEMGADVAGHDDHGVLEIDRSALTIG